MSRTRVLLSFAGVYAGLARRVARALNDAGIDVRFDPWDGGGGAPAVQRVRGGVEGIDFVVPLLTPSDAAPSWIGGEWQRAIFDAAITRGIDLLPVHGDGTLDAVPEFLRDRSFADLRGRDDAHELRRLLRTIRDRSGDDAIVLPNEADMEAPSPLLPVAHPLVLELGPAWAVRDKTETGAVVALDDGAVLMLYDGLFHELGVHFPPLETQPQPALPPLGLRILFNEVPEYEAEAVAGALLVADSAEALARQGLDAVAAVNPGNQAPAAWVAQEQWSRWSERSQTTCWDAGEFVILALSAAMRRKAGDFLGVDEAMQLLALVEPIFPRLVAETVPKMVSPFVFSDVLRRLLAEGVGIRDLHRILIALADWGRVEDDPLLLTEYARAALRRRICHQFSRGQNLLIVFLLDRAIEEDLRAAIRHTATGSYLDLPPGDLREMTQWIRRAWDALPPGVQVPQILTTMEIRSSIRRLVAPTMPLLHAVSYNELREDIDIQPIGRISRHGFEPRRGVTVGGVPLWE